ncbi:Phosphoglucomutase/phosphomannomutase, alpha/beta/alpha domain I [Shewanella morhuae]|nr:Phosphoglucomutase/phosphomannomutase, alpha/beta/alpha domain I [Shewanella morhuae]
MSRKYFGTDGVRGKVGEFSITPDFAMKLGWAAGTALASSGTKEYLLVKIPVAVVICLSRQSKRVFLLRV